MLEKKNIAPNNLRKLILDLVYQTKEGHIASCFSIIEILIAVFYDMQKRNQFDLKNFVLSKGHSSYSYYAYLNEVGLLDINELKKTGSKGNKLYGHLPFIKEDDRFQFASGSLGHGLPYALGLAKSKFLLNNNDFVYCVIGDGEANEGTFWESLLIAKKFNGIKIKILVDSNDSSERAIPIKKILNNINKVFSTFTFLKCDGHDIKQIQKSLENESNISIIVCKTKKGYPIKFMQKNPIWHHKVPTFEELIEIKKLL